MYDSTSTNRRRLKRAFDLKMKENGITFTISFPHNALKNARKYLLDILFLFLFLFFDG
jgi:hypothetical protein